jgi:hypothetical protein
VCRSMGHDTTQPGGEVGDAEGTSCHTAHHASKNSGKISCRMCVRLVTWSVLCAPCVDAACTSPRLTPPHPPLAAAPATPRSACPSFLLRWAASCPAPRPASRCKTRIFCLVGAGDCQMQGVKESPNIWMAGIPGCEEDPPGLGSDRRGEGVIVASWSLTAQSCVLAQPYNPIPQDDSC